MDGPRKKLSLHTIVECQYLGAMFISQALVYDMAYYPDCSSGMFHETSPESTREFWDYAIHTGFLVAQGHESVYNAGDLD